MHKQINRTVYSKPIYCNQHKITTTYGTNNCFYLMVKVGMEINRNFTVILINSEDFRLAFNRSSFKEDKRLPCTKPSRVLNLVKEPSAVMSSGILNRFRKSTKHERMMYSIRYKDARINNHNKNKPLESTRLHT